jgi:TM2 domain-containing membrane protein YozV
LKNKVVAGILAILLGGLGIHKFYLGKLGQGILYLLFSWTGIPSIIGFIEGILYLVKSDEEFNRQYNYHLED